MIVWLGANVVAVGVARVAPSHQPATSAGDEHLRRLTADAELRSDDVGRGAVKRVAHKRCALRVGQPGEVLQHPSDGFLACEDHGWVRAAGAWLFVGQLDVTGPCTTELVDRAVTHEPVPGIRTGEIWPALSVGCGDTVALWAAKAVAELAPSARTAIVARLVLG